MPALYSGQTQIDSGISEVGQTPRSGISNPTDRYIQDCVWFLSKYIISWLQREVEFVHDEYDWCFRSSSQLTRFRNLCLSEFRSLPEASFREVPVADVQEEIATIFFTSGTTGPSKPAIATHWNYTFNFLIQLYDALPSWITDTWNTISDT